MKKTDSTFSSQPDQTAVPARTLPWKRFAGAFLAGIPFFCMLPYTVNSWRSSPMDRANWIFHLAFLLLAACAVPAIKDSVKELKRSGIATDIMAILFVIVFALFYYGGVMRQINMIRILAGTGFWWAGLWLFCGWRAAWAALPAFAALSLGCTSSTFVLCNHFLIQPQTALFLKIGVTVLCAVLCAVIMLTDYVVKFEVLCFLFVAAIIIFCSLNIRGGDKTAPPFRPDLTVAPAGLTIVEIPLSEDTVRFFEGAEAHQYSISDGVFHAGLLEVKCGDDIHKIHPASHCLRSGGAVIQSESVVVHTMPDGQKLAVTEIRSKIRGTPALTFVWYTGPEKTTGGFYTFRRQWSPAKQWYSYQIVTDIYDGNEDAAREFLLDVLSRLKRPYQYPAQEQSR